MDTPGFIRAQRSDNALSGAIDLLACTIRDGRTFPATGFTFDEQPADDPNKPVPPTCQLAPDVAQRLMDDLFACGVRPSSAPDLEAVVAAKDMHIASLEAIIRLLPPCRTTTQQ